MYNVSKLKLRGDLQRKLYIGSGSGDDVRSRCIKIMLKAFPVYVAEEMPLPGHLNVK